MSLEKIKRQAEKVAEEKSMFIARKETIDLSLANTRKLVAKNTIGITILNKGTGTFILTLKFLEVKGLYEMTLNQDEVLNGDVLKFGTHVNVGFYDLYVTNAAQAGLSVKLIVESAV